MIQFPAALTGSQVAYGLRSTKAILSLSLLVHTMNASCQRALRQWHRDSSTKCLHVYNLKICQNQSYFFSFCSIQAPTGGSSQNMFLVQAHLPFRRRALISGLQLPWWSWLRLRAALADGRKGLLVATTVRMDGGSAGRQGTGWLLQGIRRDLLPILLGRMKIALGVVALRLYLRGTVPHG